MSGIASFQTVCCVNEKGTIEIIIRNEHEFFCLSRALLNGAQNKYILKLNIPKENNEQK